MPSSARPRTSVRSMKRVTNGDPCMSLSDRANEESSFERTSSISVLSDSDLVVTILMSAVRCGSAGMITAACLRSASRMRHLSSLV